MAKQRINIGEAVNDKRGDPLRTAFDKVNQNFDELYALTGGASAALTELAQDYAATLFTHANHTNITATYDDANNKILLTGTAAQIQSDWSVTNNTLKSFIANKPTIPAAQIQSDWTQTSNVALDFIKNKPTIPTSFSSLVNGSKTVSLGADGSLTLPAGTTYEYFDTPLTGHGNGLARLDFSLATDGVSAQWLAASPSPAGSGYSVGNTFTFNATFLGIPGASVTIEVLSIGPGGSIDELGFTIPPLYPADIYRDSPINLQVGPESNRWTFGADGTSTLPGDLNVGSNSIREDGLFSQQFSIAAGAGKHVEISSDGGGKVWSFGTDGKLTLPDSATLAVGDISVLQGLELAYDNSREQLNNAFAGASWTGAGYPAGPASSQALNIAKALNPLIPDAWITLAQSVRTAWLALGSALEPIYLDIQVAGHTWNFSNAGDLSVPGNKAIKGFDNLQLNVDGGGGKTATVEIDGYNSKVLIKTTTPGAGIPDDAWTFGDAGELTLPVGGVIQTLTTPQVGTRLTDIPGWIRADINAKTAGFWMDTTPQSLKDAMDATGLVDWQFNPDGTTDYYQVLAAEYVEDNTILELTFDDNLPLTTTYSVTSPNYSARTSSNISIIANENEWIFDTDGKLRLPVSGDIVDSTGASVLGTGNIEFRNDSMNDINGILITNASQTTAATATITITPNGSNNPTTINSVSGVQVTTDAGTWNFDKDGTLTLPLGGTLDETPAAMTVVIFGADYTVFNQTYTKTSGDPTYPDQYVGSNNCRIFRDSGTGNKWRLREDFTDYYESTNLRSWTALLGGDPIGGDPSPKTIDISTGTEKWAFGDNGSLTLPGTGWIKDSIGRGFINVNTFGDTQSIVSLGSNAVDEIVTSTIEITPSYGIGLTSVRNVDITAGYDIATVKWDLWQAAEAIWVDIRNQDAQLFEVTRPWAGMPSYEAYPVLLNYNHTGPNPPSGNLAPAAGSANNAYMVWQAEQDSINVTVTARDKTWTFGNDGQLIVPGAIRKNGGLYMNSGGNGISSTVFVNGTAGSVVLRTDNGTSSKSLTFDIDGLLTVPGSISASSPATFQAVETLSLVGVGDTYASQVIAGGVVGLVDINIYNLDTNSTAALWRFDGSDGSLTLPNNSLQRDSENTICAANADTLIYADTDGTRHTIKLVVQVEGLVGNESTTDTQSCEILVARSINGNRVSATTYAVVHTSASPLATFAASWNSGIGRVVVTCRPTSLINGVTVRTFATEIKRSVS